MTVGERGARGWTVRSDRFGSSLIANAGSSAVGLAAGHEVEVDGLDPVAGVAPRWSPPATPAGPTVASSSSDRARSGEPRPRSPRGVSSSRKSSGFVEAMTSEGLRALAVVGHIFVPDKGDAMLTADDLRVSRRQPPARGLVGVQRPHVVGGVDIEETDVHVPIAAVGDRDADALTDVEALAGTSSLVRPSSSCDSQLDADLAGQSGVLAARGQRTNPLCLGDALDQGDRSCRAACVGTERCLLDVRIPRDRARPARRARRCGPSGASPSAAGRTNVDSSTCARTSLASSWTALRSTPVSSSSCAVARRQRPPRAAAELRRTGCTSSTARSPSIATTVAVPSGVSSSARRA